MTLRRQYFTVFIYIQTTLNTKIINTIYYLVSLSVVSDSVKNTKKKKINNKTKSFVFLNIECKCVISGEHIRF